MDSNNIDYLVDLQGFKIPEDSYIVKELAYVPVCGSADPQVLMFKPPYPWKKLSDKYKRENLWLQRCYHGLDWSSGEFEYFYVGSVLYENLDHASRILVSNEI